MKCPKCRTDNPEDSKFCKECATSLTGIDDVQPSFTKTLETPVDSLTRGSLFADRYEIIEELGRGGMGAVYRAEDTKAKEEIALKLIKPEIASDQKTIERFRNELTTARRIAHRNVCKMFDLGEEKGTHYIMMEYVSGEDLKSLISRIGRMPIDKALDIGCQICDGLSEAHRLGIIHRDLKPGNIMIDKAGNAKIMDFGIARSGKESKVTGTGVIIGTPEYMSPEQAEAEDLDPRSDIYSLGIILYEMVTGQVPFSGKSGLSIAMKQRGEQPKSPQEINPSVPVDLARLILKCLEKACENRFQSAAELRSELEQIGQSLPTKAYAETKGKRTSKEITVTFGVKKLMLPAVIILVAIVTILLVWQPWSTKHPIVSVSDKPTLIVLPFENLSSDSSLEGWTYGLLHLLVTDLAQSKYLHILDDNEVYGLLERMNLTNVKKFTSRNLIDLCDAGRAQYVVSGSLLKAGNSIVITAKLQDPRSGELLFSEERTCSSEEDIIVRSDDFAPLIKASLDLGDDRLADDFDESLGSITTRSAEAFLQFTEGVKRYNLGLKNEAIPFLDKAIEVDPQFVMAYNYRSRCSPALGEQPREFLQRAFDYRENASVRERLRIEGDYYQSNFPESEYARAIDAHLRLLEIYPDDNVGNRSLGILYSKIEDMGKALKYFKVNVENHSVVAFDYYNLSQAYEDIGQVDKAKEIIQLCEERIPDSTVPASTWPRYYLKLREYGHALEEIDRYFLINPQGGWGHKIKGDIHLLMDDWDEAEHHYIEVLNREPRRGRDRLAALYQAQGQFKKAEEQLSLGSALFEAGHWRRSNFLRRLGYVYAQVGDFDQATGAAEKAVENAALTGSLRMHIQRRALYTKGLILLKLGAVDEALQVAGQLRTILDIGLNRKAERYYHFLMGLVALENRDYSVAIGELSTACTLLRPQAHEDNYLIFYEHAVFYEALAHACYLAENLSGAKEACLNILELTSGRLYYGDIYARTFYMLGKIYEKEDDRSKAVENYEKFLSLWKNADPGIPEVADAKERLRLISN